MSSHKFAKMLGKFKINKSKHASIVMKKRVISTVGSKDKKILRKYVKKREQNIVTRPVEKVVRASKAANSKLTCAICDKSFGVRSLYVRHVSKLHPELADTMLQTLPSVKVKKCPFSNVTIKTNVLPPATPTLPVDGQTKPKRTPVSPKKFKDSFERYENPTIATPNRFSNPGYDRSISSPATTSLVKTKRTPKSGIPKTPKTPKTPKVPKTADYYSTLECPDCSKIFIAKSVFERHLQSAKHGHYNQAASPSCYPQWPGYSSPLTPQPSDSWAAPPVATSPPTPGSPSPKIDCHLCGQTFMRVKDLVKHREKVCSAYHNKGKQ